MSSVYAVDWEFWIAAFEAVRCGLATGATVGPFSLAHGERDAPVSRRTVDLEEQRRLMERLFRDPGRPGLREPEQLRRRGQKRLARAYMSRAYAGGACAWIRDFSAGRCRRLGDAGADQFAHAPGSKVAARMAWNEVSGRRG